MSARVFLHPRLISPAGELTPGGGAFIATLEAHGYNTEKMSAALCDRRKKYFELARVLESAGNTRVIERMDGVRETHVLSGPQAA